MTLEERGDELVITHLPVEQMALLSLGIALTREENIVLKTLLEGKRVSMAEEALEYKQYSRTAERGVYVRFTGMERQLREMGIGRPRRGGRTL